jgi:hypothetical protein
VRTALLLAAAVAYAATFALVWPRHRSRVRLVRRVYRHVDEVLGARKYEADRAATLRRRWSWISRDLANALYPPTQHAGAVALPRYHRMRRGRDLLGRPSGYVDLALSPVPWPRRFRPWHVPALTLRWTSEAGVAVGGHQWFTRLEKQVAQALGLEWSDELFETKAAFSHDRVRLVLARPRPVPDGLPFRPQPKEPADAG